MCVFGVDGESDMGEEERETEAGEPEETEEGAEVRVRAELEYPTPKELREHMATHIPFRAWCPHGVVGKGKCHPHFRRIGEEVGTPTISFD